MIKDCQINEALFKNGYAIIGRIDQETLAQLSSYVHTQKLNHLTFFYYSLLNNDVESSQRFLKQIKCSLDTFNSAHFENFRTITESFLIKPAHFAEELFLHQDWCYTDEQKYTAYNVWIPLCDVTQQNGALYFLDGSHKWFDNKRSGSLHSARISSHTFEKQISIMEMKKGEVLLFHPAVFHGSFPNFTDYNRTVVATTIIEKSAPFLYYQKIDENTVEIIELDDEYFIKDLEPLTKGETPEGKSLGLTSYKHFEINQKLLQEHL
jgi:hypothetical protein